MPRQIKHMPIIFMTSSFELENLVGVLLCPSCGGRLHFAGRKRTCCGGSGGAIFENNILCYRRDISSPEMIVRDKQAQGYLQHAKLPTQISRMQRFMASLSPATKPVLDLGCGPGPSTELLIERGFQVVAVDFSRRSLELNKAKSALFVHADLRDIHFVKNSVDGLMMADFLQHLGDLSVQERFLREIFESLTAGGWFYLSVFNTNIKNRLHRDIDGSFANGRIRYTRLTPAEILKMLPAKAAVDAVRPMNVFHRSKLDELASRLPLARLIARMIVISGRKR